jgi:hypothetical protein
MGVQLVTDDMPARGLGMSCHNRLQVRQEICLCAGGSTGWSQDLTSNDIAAENEGARAMAHVLKLPPLHVIWSQGQARMLAFKRLDSS